MPQIFLYIKATWCGKQTDQGQWWSIFSTHLQGEHSSNVHNGRAGRKRGMKKDLPATSGAMVAPVWLDELTIATIPDPTMFADYMHWELSG